jgi:hypothetical protein
MKKLFYIGLIALGLFEILNVYFIMPMPGSQQMNSIGVAYFLYSWRWFFRIAFGIMILAGGVKAFQSKRKWIPAVSVLPVLVIIYFFNFDMTADHMFLPPEELTFKARGENTLSDSSVVIAVTHEGEAKAYPVRFIVYHHQVRDTIGGKPIMVTYCSVCRTGRVFEPVVNGKTENFRLVGMDHFNAMFEDETTKSWWRQATGEAITGSLKGNTLPEMESTQITLNQFFSANPLGKVMQAEAISKQSYDTLGRFERGKSKGKLTRTDSLSWKDKSWVVGIQLEGKTKAYDWNDLKDTRVINDLLGNTPVVIALSEDGQSFAAFKRNSEAQVFTIKNDSLTSNTDRYDFTGNSSGNKLVSISAYQEFWHSWKTFHPQTAIYKK